MNEARIQILGCEVDPVGPDSALARVERAIREKTRLTLCALNTAKLIAMRRDCELRAEVTASELVYADGAGICLAARIAGTPVPCRLAGIDLMQLIMAEAARRGWRPYLLGARPDVVRTAAETLEKDLPGLSIAGWRNGYFDPSEEPEVIREINRSGADCLFVALPSPMKERFIARNSAKLAPPVLMGVGGSLDVIAGLTSRAPVWIQRIGCEWLYRFWQEPGRMAWRYISSNTIFAGLLVRLAIQRLGQSGRPVG